MTLTEVRALLEQNKAMYKQSEKPLTDNEAAIQLGVWASALKDISPLVALEAMQKAFTVCRFPVTLADLMGQLRAMQASCERSPAELWCDLVQLAKHAASTEQEYRFTARTPEGPTQGELARKRNRERFEKLPLMVQKYLGNLNGLITMGRMDEEALRFERNRFEKACEEYRVSNPLCTAALNYYYQGISAEGERPALKE